MASHVEAPEMADCPCGAGISYSECCGPRHDGSQPAETAEALMRSRYSAFARGDGAYIVATQAPALSEGGAEAVSGQAREVTWLGLRVLRTERGSATDARGMVEFEVRYQASNQIVTFREVSRFDRVAGRWRYLEGRQVHPRPTKTKA